MFYEQDSDELRFALGVMQQQQDRLLTDRARIDAELLKLGAKVELYEQELNRRACRELQLEMSLPRFARG